MTRTYSQFERERAKRLYAAIMSSQQGSSFQTEYKRLGDRPLGAFWYQLADDIARAIADSIGTVLQKSNTPTIQ